MSNFETVTSFKVTFCDKLREVYDTLPKGINPI
jgi:hypothetical protein